MNPAEISVIGAIVVVSIAVFTYMFVLMSKNKSNNEVLLVSLSILTLVGMILYAVTKSEILATISATGVGALAGAITALYSNDDNKKPKC
jgi:uncharacterized membrane protein